MNITELLAAGLTLAEVARTAGCTLHYAAGFSVGFTTTYDRVDELPKNGSNGTIMRSEDVAEFALGKLAGQRERRRVQDGAETAVIAREA